MSLASFLPTREGEREEVESVLIPFVRPDAGSLPLPRLRAATYERSEQVVRTFHAGR